MPSFNILATYPNGQVYETTVEALDAAKAKVEAQITCLEDNGDIGWEDLDDEGKNHFRSQIEANETWQSDDFPFVGSGLGLTFLSCRENPDRTEADACIRNLRDLQVALTRTPHAVPPLAVASLADAIRLLSAQAA